MQSIRSNKFFSHYDINQLSQRVYVCVCKVHWRKRSFPINTTANFYENNLNAYDIAAGALIVKEAGGLITDYKGQNNWLFEGEILATAPQFQSEMLNVTANFE